MAGTTTTHYPRRVSEEEEPSAPPEKKGPGFYSRGDMWAVAAGLFSVAVAVGVRFGVGTAYNAYEARKLMHSLVDGSLYLVSTTGTASATIVALMLTLLGLATSVDHTFSRALYGQIRWISILAGTTLAGSVVTLLLMSIPLEDSDEFPHELIPAVYYTVSGLVAALSGLLIAVVVMLVTAVLGLIRTLAPDADVTEESAADDPPSQE